MRSFVLLLAIFALASVSEIALAQGPTSIPESTKQLIVTVPDGWNTHRASMWQFQRAKAGGAWNIVSAQPTSVLLGKNGSAWGLGILPVPHGQQGIPSKQEKDGRAPAGCFRIGKLYGYAAAAPTGATIPFDQVTARDCWIDDISHPAYNKHVEVDTNNLPPWYAKQRMRLGDFAYEWLMEIRHNSDPPKPGAGSAIFFHIRRGQDSPTAGCTTMAKEQLVGLIKWIKPEAQPLYVLLPKAEYNARLKSWALPALPKQQ